MPNAGCTIRLLSGPEVILSRLQDNHWTASVALTTSFQAVDVDEAQEGAIPDLIAVVEKTLGDLRDMQDDLGCLKTT
jgi:hypothetical protein